MKCRRHMKQESLFHGNAAGCSSVAVTPTKELKGIHTHILLPVETFGILLIELLFFNPVGLNVRNVCLFVFAAAVIIGLDDRRCRSRTRPPNRL